MDLCHPRVPCSRVTRGFFQGRVSLVPVWNMGNFFFCLSPFSFSFFFCNFLFFVPFFSLFLPLSSIIHVCLLSSPSFFPPSSLLPSFPLSLHFLLFLPHPSPPTPSLTPTPPSRPQNPLPFEVTPFAREGVAVQPKVT